MKDGQRRILLGILFGIGWLAWGGMAFGAPSLQEPCPRYEDGVFIDCRGGPIPGATPAPGPAPTPVCPSWTVIIESGPHRDESRGQCYYIVRPYERCGGTFGEPMTQYTDCPRPAMQNPCVDENGHPLISAGPDGIVCGRAGSSWRIEARVRMPAFVVDVRPYPATLVGWPTAIRLTTLPTAEGSGTLDYIPLGGGTPENPKPGDWRNVRLTLRLKPGGWCQVTLPNARGPMMTLRRPAHPLPLYERFRLAAQGAFGAPTYIYWEVPSHPAAGNTFLDPGLNARVGLPGDFPAFRGEIWAPYYLEWEFAWEEYKEESNKYCDDRSPAGNECDSNGDGVKDKKWRWETKRWWEAGSESGILIL